MKKKLGELDAVGEMDLCKMQGCRYPLLRNGRHVNTSPETKCLNALLDAIRKERAN